MGKGGGSSPDATYGSGLERRLHLLVLQLLPVHVAEEAVLPDVSLPLRPAAQALGGMLRHQLHGQRERVRKTGGGGVVTETIGATVANSSAKSQSAIYAFTLFCVFTRIVFIMFSPGKHRLMDRIKNIRPQVLSMVQQS